jgi:hypothetical protein
MTTIPEIRAEMLRTADSLKNPALQYLIRSWEKELHRRPYVRKASRKSNPCTDQIDRRIRAYARLHKDASQQEIANAHGVNPGRVSEALAGKRT